MGAHRRGMLEREEKQGRGERRGGNEMRRGPTRHLYWGWVIGGLQKHLF